MAYAPLTKIPQQFFNNLGNPLVGGTISAFLAGTSTPTNMFSDNAGTVAGTTVTLDSRGEPTTFKLIWLNTAVIYKFVLKDNTGTTIWTIDNISGDDGTGNTASSVFDQQTITATAGQTVFNLGYSYVTGTNAMAVYKNGSRLITGTDFTETSSTSVTLTMAAIAGDEYTFIGGQDVSSSFSSTNVSFIQSGTGAVTRSVQTKLRETVSVKDFGAVGDGTTDDTAAFNLAIAYANSRGGVDAANITGTTIFIPDGRYKITATLTTITKSGCEFVGASRNGAVLLCPSDTTLFVFGDGTNTVVGGGVSKVKIEYTSAPLAAIFAKIDYGFRLRFDDLLLVNIGTLLYLGQTSVRVAGGINVSRINGYVNNGGVSLFNLRYGAGLFITDASVFVGGVSNPTHPASMTTVYGTHVFKCDVGSWDTLQAVNCLFERFDIGVSCVAGASMVYQNFFFSNVIFDYLRRWCVYAEANAAGAVISTFKFDTSCWFVTWEEDALTFIRTAGFNDNHSVSGNISFAGKYGIKYQVDNGETNSFQNIQVNGCNRLGTVAACLQFQSGSRGFSVTNVKGNNDATLGWTRPDYGIVVAADCDEFIVTGCALEGPVGGYSFAANASGSSQRRAFNNVKANYAGYSGTAMPSSGVQYVNKTPFVQEWNFFGGTITGGYDKNGQGFPGALASLHIRLQPNDNFTCGYSVAPTVKVFVEP